jgi:hypothetical protein
MRHPYPDGHDPTRMLALRRAILDSPVTVALERARTYTRVFRQNEAGPWIVTKAMAFREHLEALPLYLREHDRIAGAICETPGATPDGRFEIGIAPGQLGSAQAHAAAPPVVGLQPGQGSPRVLVVDDREENRTLLAEILRAVGFQTRESATGRSRVRRSPSRWQCLGRHAGGTGR